MTILETADRVLELASKATAGYCPICGETKFANPCNEFHSGFIGSVVCSKPHGGCGCVGPVRRSPEEAIVAWNRRADAPALAQAVKDQHKEIKRLVDLLRPIGQHAKLLGGAVVMHRDYCELAARAVSEFDAKGKVQ